MKVDARMKFLGVEKGVSKEGKTYFFVGLLQDYDSERVYVDEGIYNQVKDYKPFSDVDCKLRIQIGTRTFVNLDSIELVK